MESEDKVRDRVKEYYGKTVQKTDDLSTNVSCPSENLKTPKHIREARKLVHEEVANKYYGCGLVIPECLDGISVLDLGSGAGLDCFTLSKLVGQNGHVTGVDMTDEQLAVANKYIPYHTEKFGYTKPNVNFVKGYIEKLQEAGLKENTFDVIVSNCVVNLSPDKKAVLSQACHVLKVGGEFYFSDVYADRSLSDEVRKHEVLWGECIAGALWWEDLIKLAKEVGFSEPRLVRASSVVIDKDDLKAVIGDAKFVSVVYRMFKLPEKLDDACQVIYEGTITEQPDELCFDHQNIFKTGEPSPVDAELATILQTSRFKDDFTFQPPSKKAAPACCPAQNTKSVHVNPFEYLEAQEKLGKAEPAACCAGAKSCC